MLELGIAQDAMTRGTFPPLAQLNMTYQATFSPKNNYGDINVNRRPLVFFPDWPHGG